MTVKFVEPDAALKKSFSFFSGSKWKLCLNKINNKIVYFIWSAASSGSQMNCNCCIKHVFFQMSFEDDSVHGGMRHKRYAINPLGHKWTHHNITYRSVRSANATSEHTTRHFSNIHLIHMFTHWIRIWWSNRDHFHHLTSWAAAWHTLYEDLQMFNNSIISYSDKHRPLWCHIFSEGPPGGQSVCPTRTEMKRTRTFLTGKHINEVKTLSVYL